MACAAAMVAGCGSGGSDAPAPAPAGPVACGVCTASTLSGVAAAGTPMVNASLLVIDSLGAGKSGTADAKGAFSINVAGMTAPFVIEATGTIGGQTVQYHSLALAADVGMNQVNVTSLTEIMSAIVLGGVPTTLINAGTVDASKITSASITSAESTVHTLVAPVLQAAGASNSDLRTAQLTANGTGLDLALDGLSVALVDGSYAVSTSVGSSSTVVAPGQAASSAALTVPDNAATLLASGTSAATGLQSLMSSLTTQFAAKTLPAASSLSPLLATDFLHDGQAGPDYVQKILLQDSAAGLTEFNLIGATFDQVRVTQVIDANNVKFQYRVSAALNFRPWSESMYATLSNGQWLLRGDQQKLGVSVNAMALLVETPAAMVEMLAAGAALVADGVPPYYTVPVKDAAGNKVGDAWSGYPGDSSFGWNAWYGDETDPTGRLLRATYPLYFAHPDTQVRLEMVFTVHNNRVASNVATVIVTGPGLPAQGLTLQPSPADSPRDNWVFPGPENYKTVNSFSNYGCIYFNQDITRVLNCGFDWTQVQQGARYTFTARDSGGAVVDTQMASLPLMPQQSEAQMYAKRASLFAQMTPDTSKLYSVVNFYKDNGGPFVTGSTVPVSWTLPTGAGAQLSGIYTFQQWRTNTTYPFTYASSGIFKPLYGVQPPPTTSSYLITAPQMNWSSADISVFDVFGNEYHHRVDGLNHL